MSGLFSIFSKPSYSEPSARAWHYAASVNEKQYMWGGYSLNFDNHIRKGKLTSTVQVYDPFTEEWEGVKTTGVPPSALFDGACTSMSNCVYSCGGRDISGTLQNTLYRLDTTSMCWNEVQTLNPRSGPMFKCGCGLVAYEENKLALFGGRGIPLYRRRRGPKAELEESTEYTNEFHLINLINVFPFAGTWTTPATTGLKPSACAHFSLTSIDPKRAVLFGGSDKSELLDDVYIVDLEAMHWTKMNKPPGSLWPSPRMSHAACCLDYGKEQPQLLISGGLTDENQVLSDAWLLDVESRTWKEFSLPEGAVPRAGHSAFAFSLVPGLVEVTLFGGFGPQPPPPTPPPTSPQQQQQQQQEEETKTEETKEEEATEPQQWSEEGAPKLAETTVLHLEYHSTGGWILTGTGRGMELGSAERLSDKMSKMCSISVESRERVTVKFQERQKALEHRMVAAKEKKQAAEKKIGKAWRKTQADESEMQENVVEAEKKVEELQEQISSSTKETEEATKKAEELEWKAQDAEQKAVEMEIKAQISGAEEPSWVVERDEFQITGEKVGEGAWANIQVAKFRGIRVAAKRLHDTAPSAFTRDCFILDMNIAARLHHPNLVQFIGATIRGDLIILTELLHTSLRAVLEKEAVLPPQQVVSVSLDVARALEFLHSSKPDPIIHRNISSANVLLEPGPQDTWRAKIVNFLCRGRQGDPTYAAPESRNPLLHSTKMDIFSVGILLVEMCTARFPDPTARDVLIQSIADRKMVELIRECTIEDRDRRPTATEVIVRLEEF